MTSLAFQINSKVVPSRKKSIQTDALSGEGDYFGFGAGLFGRRGEFAFGAQPVLHGIAGSGAAFEIDLIGASGDIVLREFGFCGGLLCLGRGGCGSLRHFSLLPQTTVLS